MLMIAACSAPLSFAGTILTVPPSLAPGSQYRLVFVTADPYEPMSSNIADYNTDVNNEANNLGGDTGSLLAGLGATWEAIASTASVNAIDNIGEDPGIPIYDLYGHLIAFDAQAGIGGIFDPGTIATPIYDAFGIQVSEQGTVCPIGFVWTGTLAPSGVGAAGYTLGTSTPIAGLCTVGETPAIDYSPSGDYRPWALYAISDVLTVPANETPEPSTAGMVIASGALLCCALGWTRRNRRIARSLCRGPEMTGSPLVRSHTP